MKTYKITCDRCKKFVEYEDEDGEKIVSGVLDKDFGIDKEWAIYRYAWICTDCLKDFEEQFEHFMGRS